MKRLNLLAACTAVLMAVPCLADADAVMKKPAVDARQPKIQIAILLDTSGSMDGLINQTREQLWRIVNTFATAKRDGKRPRLELALYHYGNDGIRGNDYVQQLVPLTTDLDKVSEKLFALRTNGGEEYCGAAIDIATKKLEWSGNPHDLKLIYIAGNEPFSQGPVDFRGAVKRAIGKGIVVNTIHAGSEADGRSGNWDEAARLADGNFLTIDQNRVVARVNAPQDAELAALNSKLNTTYIAYGARGGEAQARQVAQDKNAQGMSAGALATRAASKSTSFYSNEEWDLVDAKKKGKKVADMPVAALPAPMQKMDKEEREKFVEEKSKERAEIQAKIARLSKEREAFVAAEMKKQAEAGEASMDEALIGSAKAQAEKLDFAF